MEDVVLKMISNTPTWKLGVDYNLEKFLLQIWKSSKNTIFLLFF